MRQIDTQQTGWRTGPPTFERTNAEQEHTMTAEQQHTLNETFTPDDPQFLNQHVTVERAGNRADLVDCRVYSVNAYGVTLETLTQINKSDGSEWDHHYRFLPWSAIASITWAETSYGERWPNRFGEEVGR